MRRVFSETRRLDAMLAVEVALAAAQAKLGIIPKSAARAIAAAADVAQIDREAIRAGTERVGYPVVPLTKELGRLAGAEAAGFVHWGATTQDILDTALVLQIREALDLLEAELVAVIRALGARAQTHRDDVMAGRTHLQHALPITFGYKCAVWLAPLLDHLVTLRRLRARILVVEFGGAVGTLASLGDRGRAVTSALAEELGLGVPDAPWHADRSAIAEVACAIGVACGSLAKFAADIVLLMQTEVAEVFEPHAPGRGGSSTMPQKRNPIASEYVIAGARGVRALVPLVLEAMVGDHERSTGPWQSEELAVPQIFVWASAAFLHARTIAEGMTVDTRRMRENLEITHGLIMSEAVAMALAERLGKANAHHVVERACTTALENGTSLADVLAAEPEIANALDDAAIRQLVDPARYTGEAAAVVERIMTRAETLLRG